MKKIDIYIARHVLSYIFLVTFIISTLFLLLTFLDEAKVSDQIYTNTDAFFYTLGITPTTIYDIFPICVLLGSLIGLGVLANNSELTILRSSGWSPLRIASSASIPVLFLMVFSFFVGDKIAPYFHNKANFEKSKKRYSSKNVPNMNNLWHKDNATFINIGKLSSIGNIYNVNAYSFNEDNKMLEGLSIEEAEFIDNKWHSKNSSNFYIEQNKIQFANKNESIWDSNLSPVVFMNNIQDPSRLSVLDLFRYFKYLDEQNLNSTQYKIVFWKKLGQPLISVLLVFLSASFVFGSFRNVSFSQRLVFGILLGFSFQIMQSILEPLIIIFNFLPVFIIILPVLFCFFANIFLFRRI